MSGAEGLNAEDAEKRGERARLNAIGERVIGAAIAVHRTVGPGLLESAYEACLAHELRKQGLSVRRQVILPIVYDGVEIEAGYRLDLLIDESVVVEIKAVDRFAPIHGMQLLSYLRLGNYRLGYIINFNVAVLRDGIKRIANGL